MPNQDGKTPAKGLFDDANIIFSYSRAQAIEDGALIDVSETAREAGFKFPVAMTSESFGLCVVVPEGVSCQDEKGRLWDVLHMLHHAIKTGKGAEQVDYSLLVNNHGGDLDEQRDTVHLKALCGPGDDAAPVITIMMPWED